MTTKSTEWPLAKYASQPALQSRFKATARSLGFRATTRATAAAWKIRLRTRLREITGVASLRPAPLKPELDAAVACDGYHRQRATIQTEAGVRMTFFILTPDASSAPTGGPRAAMITPHGHGSGGKVSVAGVRDNPEVAKAIDHYNYDYGVQLARRGFIVFAPDARGFGERREATVAPTQLSGSCQYLNNMAYPLGLTVTGLWAFDLMRLIDYIETRKDCRKDRIGCGGLSGGGLQTLWLSALDDRVHTSVVSGYFYGYKQSLLDQHQNCSCNYVPHLYEAADMGDLGALIAPRPLLIETGDQDGLNGAGGLKNVTSQVKITRQAYNVLGAPKNLVHAIFQGGHKWDGTQAIPFLVDHLQK
ncbi:MAG TPA: alpha/beta hydrolase family protein [Planctomycetota bacterium]|nr:alpha/beta hydrolase family protein [Planctomycetota bacterium]